MQLSEKRVVMEPRWSEKEINYLERNRYDLAAEEYIETNLGDFEEYLEEHSAEDTIDVRMQWLDTREDYDEFRYEFLNSEEWFIKD
jgi:hypothetical protein